MTNPLIWICAIILTPVAILFIYYSSLPNKKPDWWQGSKDNE